jgi:hypothetical protein
MDESVNKELASLKQNKNLEIVNSTINAKRYSKSLGLGVITACDGNARFKVRIVAKGCKKHGFDYDEIFSPGARYDIIRKLFTVAV